ncbi:MAG: elongation factor 4, partial [Lentisphaerae bacterium]|nr:elongation factor 4 [Lentisphaerota bacterium]
MPPLANIRNFCIIAHIDHGKSTLADRLLEHTHTIAERDFRDQVLDDMDLERERGITIKSHPVTMNYVAEDGQEYELNLIDTPGHVDFSYEVTRSIAACEGAILVVDAAQGVEAQTVANTQMALARGLEIIPVINKIDLPNADVEGVATQIEELLAVEFDECICMSAKTGEGVTEVLRAIVERMPPPREQPGETLRALVFDSVYDAYRGVVSYIRVFDGRMKTGQRVRLMGTGNETDVKEVGTFCPKPVPSESLGAGRVGYLVGTIKDPAAIRIGDTLTLASNPATEPLVGFKEVRPMVFSGLYPVNANDYEKFRQGLDKLSLNDSAVTFHPETSIVLGFGFRCGFLGLLHMEIIQERLRREFDLDIISTHPAVVYKVCLRDGSVGEYDNPVRMPEPTKIDYIEEPVVIGFIICPNGCIGDVMKMVMDRRGEVQNTESLDSTRVIMTCM